MLISTKRILPAALAGAIALTGVLSASLPASAMYTVPNAPGVANVSVVEGNVAIVRGDSGGQVGAAINTPLLPGDYISTASSSRTEVQLDGISMLRLAENSQTRFVNLKPGSREMQLAAGTAELAELRGNGHPQLDTPSVTVRPNTTGNYRVSVVSDGSTMVTVRSGSATVSSGNASRVLAPGSTLIARGPYSNVAITFAPAIAYDAFDAFNNNRNNAILGYYSSNQYLPPDLAGYTNFADYGRWYNVANYGEVWSPYNQANDWSPYSNGQWVWEPGYGYTWVGNEPWGYAPYHYGNWFYNTGYNQWMWQPPAYQYQSNADAMAAAWLPALVGFFLTGGNGVTGYNPYGYGYGGIGWVPLAPGEAYNPWYPGFGYGASYPSYAVNNVTNIINVYRNIRYVRVVRIYDWDRFRDGDWHRPILMHPDQLRRVGVLRGPVPVVPTKALMGTGKVVAHPITVSSRFNEARFAEHRPTITTASFTSSQHQVQTAIAKAPRVVATPPHVVAPKETVRPVPVRTMTPPHVVAPKETMRPVPVRTMTPPHVVAPKETLRPVPVHTTTPVHTMPMRTMVPTHTMAPPARAMAPMHTVAPERAMTPAHPVRTPAPAAHKPAAQTPAPARKPTPANPERPEAKQTPPSM